MKKYNGNWIDQFNVSIYTGEDKPQCRNKIVLETPSIDYFFTREQWKIFKEKVNSL